MFLDTTPVDGCATIARDQITKVEIANESAIIIYDQAMKTEHFIRRASFETDALDFGFLVPTPTQPTLAEASDEPFEFLKTVTAPEVIEKKKPSGFSCELGCSDTKLETAGRAGTVEVLEQKRVGNLDAAVLKANDNAKLSEWLDKWGYKMNPTLEEWMKPYTEKGWIITAFKIAKDSTEKRVASSAVRLTFQTETPFYPYREPAQEKESASGNRRLLRVFFVGEKQMQGVVGEKANTWYGAGVVWANTLTAAQREKCLTDLKLPATTAPQNWYLTEFEDKNVNRLPDSELYFKEASTQTPIARKPTIIYVSNEGARHAAVFYGFVALVFVPYLWRGFRRIRGQK